MICPKCNNDGVKNQVLGKEFYYCRTCKDEITLELAAPVKGVDYEISKYGFSFTMPPGYLNNPLPTGYYSAVGAPPTNQQMPAPKPIPPGAIGPYPPGTYAVLFSPLRVSNNPKHVRSSPSSACVRFSKNSYIKGTSYSDLEVIDAD